MTPEVRETDPDGVDYGWVMQVTFIVALFVGVPLVTILSVFATVPSWGERAIFAIRVGAVIWLVTLLSVYLYARQYRSSEDDGDTESESLEADPEQTD